MGGGGGGVPTVSCPVCSGTLKSLEGWGHVSISSSTKPSDAAGHKQKQKTKQNKKNNKKFKKCLYVRQSNVSKGSGVIQNIQDS